MCSRFKTLCAAFLVTVLLPVFGSTLLFGQEAWPGIGSNAGVQWVGYRFTNTDPVQDPPGDAGSNSDKWDLTYVDPGAPFTLQAAASSGTAFFRLQVKSLTTLNGPGTYFVFLGNISSIQIGYVYLTLSGNNSGQIAVSNGQSAVPVSTNLGTYTRVTQTGFGSTAYVDFQVPLTLLYSALQISPQTSVKFYAGTSTGAGNFGNINLDFMTSGNSLDFSLLATASFSNIAIGVLPVELRTFTARHYDGLTELRWETATELNNYGFEVQRGTAGGEWEAIGFVPGAGTVNTPRRYTFQDRTGRNAPILRYRLRQIDRDGSEEYSPVVEAAGTVPPEAFLQCYPHPVRAESTITGSQQQPGAVRVSLLDALGRELRVLREAATDGAEFFSLRFDRGTLPNGQYYIVMHHPGGTVVRPFLLVE